MLSTLLFTGQAAADNQKGKRIYIKKERDNGKYVNGQKLAYAPGDTLVLTAAQNSFSYFSLENVHGTAGSPVVIINEGGQVHLTQGIKLTSCTHIKLTGSGSADQYGFKVEHYPATGIGVEINERSADIEVERIFVNSKLYGFWVKQDASCDKAIQYPNWTINNISIHDNRLTNLGQEGMYLGTTDPNGDRPVICNGAVTHPKPLRLGNIKVYNNFIYNTFRGGIQLSGADAGNNEIYNNTISNIGYEYDPAQGNGIVLGGYTRAYIHHNEITNTFSTGIFSLGSGVVRIEHNRVSNSGMLGGRNAIGMASIMVDTRETKPADNTTFLIRNNSLGANTDRHVRVYNTFMTFNKGNVICDNRLVDGGAISIGVPLGIDWSNCAANNKPPVAKAGPDQTLTLPINYTQLWGSGTDADGLITTYNWSQVSGPSEALFSDAEKASPVAKNMVAGTYTFRLTVSDNSAVTGTDDVLITVNPPPPASSYKPVPGKIEAESWDLMDGIKNESTKDAGVAGMAVGWIDNADWMDYNLNAAAAGTYTLNIRAATPNRGAQFQIRKPDGTVLSTVNIPVSTGFHDWRTINVPLQLAQGNQIIRLISTGGGTWNINWMEFTLPGVEANKPPLADAGSDQTIVLPAASVRLNGSGTDADGTIAAYSWTQVSGPSQATFSKAEAADPTVGNLVAGTYVFRLTVTDNKGAAVSREVTINVQAGRVPEPTYTTLPARIEAEDYSHMKGVETESTADAGGGENVAFIDNADWLDYNVQAPKAGNYTVRLRIATPNNNAQFQIRTANGALLATINVPKTGSFQSWQTVTAGIGLAHGNQVLRLLSTGGSIWNINWLELAEAAPAPAPVPAIPADGTALRIEAENYGQMKGVQTETTSDAGGGKNVAFIDNADWMDYTLHAATAGTYTIAFRVATPNKNAQFQVWNGAGAQLTVVNVPQTGGYQSWQQVSVNLNLAAGTQTIRLVSTGGGVWNINWLEVRTFIPPTPATVKIEAEGYSNMKGVQKETTWDAGGGQNVAYIDYMDWMEYAVQLPAAGTYQLNFRIATPNKNAQFQVWKGATRLSTVNLPGTGGYQKWQTVSVTLNLSAGQQTIRLLSTGGGIWNINWLEILPAGNRSAAAASSDLAVSLPQNGAAFEVYPNPVADHCLLQVTHADAGQLKVQVMGTNGAVHRELVFTKPAGRYQASVSMGQLPAGQYIIRVTMNGWTATQKVTRQ